MNHLKTMAALWLTVAALFCVSACSGGAPATTTKPTVQILAPAYGASITEGDVLAVQAVAADASGITRVELYIDGQLANTKLSQNPQGEALFNATMEWLANKLGAHNVTVRAFNVANQSAEISLPIAVNMALGTPTTEAETVPPVQVTATTEPTDAAVGTAAPTDAAPTDAVLTEPPPPTETATDVPPTNVVPTATLPPLAYQLPFDGGTNVELSWSENGLLIGANANDSLVGGENGDGIAFVEIFVQDLQGKTIAFKHDTHAPYCYFSEADGQCDFIQPDSSQFVWRNGVPITEGWYFIRAVAHSNNNTIQVGERPLRINFPPDSFENLFVNILEPSTERIEHAITFEADVSGSGADSGVDRVEMYIVQYDGKIVHVRTERTPRYCAFSGGDSGQDCPPYDFRANGGKWSSGTPIYPTQYVLRAIGYTRDGQLAATSSMVQIDDVQ